jgi:hypothetical protein
MANVFLSYAREDGAKAALIARALSGQGWTVWWDRTIPPGRTFDDVIEDALEDASCVVVLWSKAAITSHWVRAEAAEGMRRGILVPAFLEDVKIPLEFRRIQAANLTTWDGSAADPKFEQFLQSVAMLMQPTTLGPMPAPTRQITEPIFDSFERTPLVHTPPPATHGSHVAIWTIALAVLAAAITGVLAWRANSSPRADVAGAEQQRIQEAPVMTPAQSSPPVAPKEDVVVPVAAPGPAPAAASAPVAAAPAPVVAAPAPAVAAPAPVVAKPDIVRQPPKPRSEPKAAPDPEVPALTGLSSDVARDRIVRRGFNVGRVSVRPASKSETDLVLAQDPRPGTRQRPGTEISLVIGGEP